MMYKLKNCALCGEEKELELSHIIPKMAVRKLKKTSIGNIRNLEEVNRPVQDSEKHYMLCGDCEDLFSEKETYFANHLFHPYLSSNKDEFEYDETLFYFLTSVSWRSLFLDLMDFVSNSVVGIDALEHLISCEREMRDYLLGKRSDIGDIEHHILFFGEIDKIYGEIEGLERLKPHVVFHRGIFSYTFCNEEEKTYVTMTNMMGIILVTLYSRSKNEVWENTQILNTKSNIKAKNQIVRSIVGGEIIEILERVELSFNDMSETQKEKIKKKLIEASHDKQDADVFNDFIRDNNILNIIE